MDKTLRQTIDYGIAYHNSDLSSDERELVEEAYCNHVLNVLFSTTTLAAGVNLPARRVIIKDLKTGPKDLDTKHYKQM
ncbi:helicase-related protein, partial [Escherichia coli]|nr:helicase-related protein [Escherichia coli]